MAPRSAALLHIQWEHPVIRLKWEKEVREWVQTSKLVRRKVQQTRLRLSWSFAESLQKIQELSDESARRGSTLFLGHQWEVQSSPWFGLLLPHSSQQSGVSTAIRLHFTYVLREREERILSALLNLNCKAWFILIMLRHFRQKMALSLTSLIWLEGSMPSDISLHRSNYWGCLMLVKLLETNF